MTNYTGKKSIIGRVYGWDAAKMVIDWLEAHNWDYSVHAQYGVWLISYRGREDVFSIFDELEEHREGVIEQ